MTDQLSHNDPDLRLAQQIQRVREEGTSLTRLDDPLIEQLLEYKQSKHHQLDLSYSDKKAVWQKIQAATESSTTIAPVTKLFNFETLRWAAAAVLLIGAIFSFVYIQFYQQPTLLAESGGSIQSVELGDGSTVTLRPYSKLFVVEQEISSERYKLQGEGLFEVSPNADRIFSVETEAGKVSVLGTKFTLSSWGNQLQVYLQEGSVKVEALQRDSAVVLNPGESVSIKNKSTIPKVKKASADEYLDWLDQQLIFDNKPAKEVAQELEQQFNISINLPDDISDSQLSGRLAIDSLSTSLDDLELVLGGTFTQTGNRSFRFEAD